MIVINGKAFRYITDPLYANGKKVYRAYANGKLVYPEMKGKLIKVRGRISLAHTHSHVEDTTGYHSWQFGTCSATYSVTASFAAVFRIRNGFGARFKVSDATYSVQEDYDSGYYGHGYPNTYSQFKIADPFYGKGAVSGYGFSFEKYSAGCCEMVDLKAKYYCSPIPLCGPLITDGIAPLSMWTTPDGSTPVNTYRHSGKKTYTPLISALTEPQELNGIILGEGEHYTTRPKSGHIDVGISFSPYASDAEEISCCRISGYEFVFPLNYEYWDLDKGGYDNIDCWGLTYVSNIATIPITEIMYLGDYDKAPEEMKTVSDSDL
jgi:hypothetical protein